MPCQSCRASERLSELTQQPYRQRHDPEADNKPDDGKHTQFKYHDDKCTDDSRREAIALQQKACRFTGQQRRNSGSHHEGSQLEWAEFIRQRERALTVNEVGDQPCGHQDRTPDCQVGRDALIFGS